MAYRTAPANVVAIHGCQRLAARHTGQATADVARFAVGWRVGSRLALCAQRVGAVADARGTPHVAPGATTDVAHSLVVRSLAGQATPDLGAYPPAVPRCIPGKAGDATVGVADLWVVAGLARRATGVRLGAGALARAGSDSVEPCGAAVDRAQAVCHTPRAVQHGALQG